MRLKTKLIGTSILMMLLFSLLFSLFSLSQQRAYTISRETKLEMKLFQRSCHEINLAIYNAKYFGKNEIIIRAITLQAIRNNLFGSYAIYENEREIYNNTGLDFIAQKRDDKSDPIISQLEEIENKKLLILGSGLEVFQNNIMIYQSIDVTQVYQTSRDFLLRGMGLSVFLCLVIAVVLFFLTEKILMPFYRLKAAATEIGAGNYKKRVNIHTKDEIGEVAVQFDRMAENIQDKIDTLIEKNERQNLMLGSIGHELKTPMTAMIGYSDSLLRLKMSDEQKEMALRYIGKECRRLVDLSAKIMELSGLSQESKSIEMKKISIFSLAERARQTIEERIKQKQLSLLVENNEGEEPSFVWGDEALLLSLLLNVIDNAIKASSEGGKILICLNKNCLKITDEGIGIPQEEIKRVAEPFYMVDKSRSRKQGGAGLGLSLCRQIAEYHGMRLVIESNHGIGTVIKLYYR